MAHVGIVGHDLFATHPAGDDQRQARGEAADTVGARGWLRANVAAVDAQIPHQRPGVPICDGGSIGPTLVASSHELAPEYGSWTCRREPDLRLELLKSGKRGSDAEQRARQSASASERRVAGGRQPADAEIVEGAGWSAGGQPAGGGPEGPTDRASTQA